MKFPFQVWNLSVLFELSKRFGGALYTVPVWGELVAWAAPVTPLENSFGMEHWGLVRGESGYRRWNFHTSLGFLLALSPSCSFQGIGTWPSHLSGRWELSWHSLADQEPLTQAAPRPLWADTSLLCCEEPLTFPQENNKKPLSPIQAVLALELKALRPFPAPGSFPFAAVGRAVNLSMQLIYVIQIKTSCTNVIKWNSSSMFLPSGTTFPYFVVSLTFQNLSEKCIFTFFSPPLVMLSFPLHCTSIKTCKSFWNKH